MVANLQQLILKVVADEAMRSTLSAAILSMINPDPTVIDVPGGHVPKWELLAEGDVKGCNVCRSREFRDRNRDVSTGVYKCVNCGMVWEERTPAPTTSAGKEITWKDIYGELNEGE